MVWEYRGQQFPNKYTLVKQFGLSTCKFEAKVKEGEIIKLTKQANANYDKTKHI